MRTSTWTSKHEKRDELHANSQVMNLDVSFTRKLFQQHISGLPKLHMSETKSYNVVSRKSRPQNKSCLVFGYKSNCTTYSRLILIYQYRPFLLGDPLAHKFFLVESAIH